MFPPGGGEQDTGQAQVYCAPLSTSILGDIWGLLTQATDSTSAPLSSSRVNHMVGSSGEQHPPLGDLGGFCKSLFNIKTDPFITSITEENPEGFRSSVPDSGTEAQYAFVVINHSVAEPCPGDSRCYSVGYFVKKPGVYFVTCGSFGPVRPGAGAWGVRLIPKRGDTPADARSLPVRGGLGILRRSSRRQRGCGRHCLGL